MLKKITIIACCLTVAFAGSVVIGQSPVAIQGGTVITMAGDPIENGTILFRDGKIVDVGVDLKIPVEAKVIDATGKIVMPGLIESHSSSGMSQANETNPIVPYVSVLDSIDPMNNYFLNARRNGVTSVAISPGNSTLIGGQSAVIKTAGEFLDDMILKSDAGMKISLRPVNGSRMSHLAKLRKALGDAKKKMEKEAETKKEKKDGDEASAKSASQNTTDSELNKAMFEMLSGDLPAIIYCERAMDVGQALRMVEEFNLDASLVLGRDCHKAAEQVAKAGLPVIIDSTLVYWETDPRTRDETKIVVPEIFREQDVKFTFQTSRAGGPTMGGSYLWFQAATCVKHGMPKQQAMEALTTLPAQFLGVDQLIGSIEKGKDGDVIILSGDPLKVSTWVEKTIVNGEVVYDRDEDEQLKRLLGEEASKN